MVRVPGLVDWNDAQSTSLPSAHHVIHGSTTMKAGMNSSPATIFEDGHWWKQRRQQLSIQSYQGRKDATISLPLPSFPPALDFGPSDFILPPPYSEVADVEKALHTFRSRRTLDSHVSNLCSAIPSADTFQPRITFIQEPVPIPARRHVRIIRHLRYATFTVYRRLFTLVVLLNLIGVYVLLREQSRIDTIGALASSNFLLAILVRQDYLVNTLFRTAWLVPWAVPLRVRRVVARVYCYGGIHSGAAVAGTGWWIGFTVVSTIARCGFWFALQMFRVILKPTEEVCEKAFD
jgi:hypothetical protein